MKYRMQEIARKVGRNAKRGITGINNLILRSTSELLKPTQIVYNFVNLPNKDDLFLKIKSTLYKVMGGKAVNLKQHFTHHLYYFSPLTIEKLLNKCGFHIVKMELNVEDLIIANKKGVSILAKVALKRLCYLIMTVWKSKRNEIVVFAKCR